MARVRGVILDVDGTLVDSNDAHAKSWVEVFAADGITVPYEDVRRLIGMGGDKLLPKVSGVSADSPEGKRLTKRHLEVFKSKYLPHLQPCCGARDLLRHMHDRGLNLVVATSAKADVLEPLLKICGADAFIKAKTTSDDAEHSKPDPDIVHAALSDLGDAAKGAIMLGDTPYDVEAAGRAGIGTIAVRCGGWGDKELAGALAVYDDPADLLAHYDQSPLADQRS